MESIPRLSGDLMAPSADCPARRDIERLARGQLPDREAEELGRHVLECSACAHLLNDCQAGDTLIPVLQAVTGQEPLGDPFVDDLVERLAGSPPDSTLQIAPATAAGTAAAAARPLPALPGYEVLAVVGRGGQSIVYKARQLVLNRLVALKVFPATMEANAEERARFRREAEAVAHLEHPNIVQIYDVGEQAGQPYFAMEYLSGGTLAKKLAGVPLPGLEGARLLECLGRTMHWAHQRGIIHRDLKPGNVLVTADGSLKIADFGLAKRLEADAALTHSGYVIGTPSYMAPEQAAGKTREIGPAADVYALGVIGYEMLTGRPPFLGATAWDIIPQVLEADPVAPRRLQPTIPRDLETICLKCLHKEPHRRYATALELAEDLELYQKGLPIQARPVRWPERLLKWVKRRPAVAALTAAVVLILLLGLVTSLVLTGWALRERDLAQDRLDKVQKAERRRVRAQVEQLGTAAPEAVPGLLAVLKEEREIVLPRLRELWADQRMDRKRRMRTGLALADEDPTVRKTLAGWMIEAEDPREVLLVRKVLTAHGAESVPSLWKQVNNPQARMDARFRALVALAAFDPVNGRWSMAASMAVEQLLQADPLFVPYWMKALRPVRDDLQKGLVLVFRGQRKRLADRRLVAATVLADYCADQPVVLADLACDADAEQFWVLRPVLEKNRRAVRKALHAELAKRPPAKEREVARILRARRQANAAAALLVLGEPEAAWPLLEHCRTPDARTVLIHALAPRGADPRVLIRRLKNEKDAFIRAALILALGEYTAEQLSLETRAALQPKLLEWYRNDPDPGVHGAIDWLLRHSKEGLVDRPLDWDGRRDLETIEAELTGKRGRAGQRWYVNGQGQTLAAVPGPVKVLMGSPRNEAEREDNESLHICKINRSFAVATTPVTVSQWKKFMEAMNKAKLEIGHFYTKKYAPESGCPIIDVTWYEAAMYCRWLSEMERLSEEQMVYPPIKDILKCVDGQTPLKLPKDYLSRTGYRLPTEAEYEYACRANTATRWYFGGVEELLPRHAWFLKNSEDRTWPTGQKKPNGLGLFDMHGNVWIWCQGGYRPYNPGRREDKEDNRDVIDSIGGMLRGGSFLSQAGYVRSASRDRNAPTYRYRKAGLRPARTLPLGHFTVATSE
jgi:formylglycine-generating enzyme required for sulfatase activity/tRNA A-37 threonylcarbamoyl transferase component Bud32